MGYQTGIERIFKKKNSELRILENLHSKIVVSDNSFAIIASGNLTSSALETNIEYGVLLEEYSLISELLNSVNRYWKDAAVVDHISPIDSSLRNLRTKIRRNSKPYGNYVHPKRR
jgi:phosphatidylserine/phosphatidylglycerophosphate/cardiolipin synthase-like enzyme